tara:strand:+ start:1497 stop:1724 length:228 start_codon:yes stop_codon:yes gene_type:complete
MNIEITNIFTNILNKYSKTEPSYRAELSLEEADVRAHQFKNNQRALNLANDNNELQKLNDLLITLQNGGDEDCKP